MADIRLPELQSAQDAHTCKICEEIVLDLTMSGDVQHAAKHFKRAASTRFVSKNQELARGLVPVPPGWDIHKGLTSKTECLLLQQMLADKRTTPNLNEAEEPQQIYVVWCVGMYSLDPMGLSLSFGLRSDEWSGYTDSFQYDINLQEGKL
jgi:hypothetical protein